MDNKKEMWENHPEIWKTRAAWFSYLRGVLRNGWRNFPVKTKFMKNNRKRIKNPNKNGRNATVWGAECAMCHNEFPSKDLQVDHKLGASSLNDWEDLESFTRRLFDITEDDLQYLCKSCHGIKTMMERYDISYDEAVLRKEKASFSKLTIGQMQSRLRVLGVKDVPKTKVACKALFAKKMEGVK